MKILEIFNKKSNNKFIEMENEINQKSELNFEKLMNGDFEMISNKNTRNPKIFLKIFKEKLMKKE